jgi:hypothetical protein
MTFMGPSLSVELKTNTPPERAAWLTAPLMKDRQKVKKDAGFVTGKILPEQLDPTSQLQNPLTLSLTKGCLGQKSNVNAGLRQAQPERGPIFRPSLTPVGLITPSLSPRKLPNFTVKTGLTDTIHAEIARIAISDESKAPAPDRNPRKTAQGNSGTSFSVRRESGAFLPNFTVKMDWTTGGAEEMWKGAVTGVDKGMARDEVIRSLEH